MRKDLEWEYADAEVLKARVKEIGAQLGFYLPQDYIKCVKVNGGASVLPEEFNVEDVERCFGSLFSFDEKSSQYIVKKYESYNSSLPRDILPIATDPAGNLLCFDYKDQQEKPVVVFLEHENVSEKETLMYNEGLTDEQVEECARENLLYVAATFTAFLDKLHD